jgi:probable phosphoglycerate mutase
MHLYVIRHGQSLINLSDWQHGNRDEGLTDLGLRQAHAVADRLAKDPGRIDALYSSTMVRARETAAVIGDTIGMAVVHDDRIREIGNNRLDHLPWPEVPQEYGDFWATARPFASVTPKVELGESLMHFRTRVGAFIEDLLERHAGEVVVAVAHGGVLDALFDHVFNVGPWRRCQVWMHNAAVTHLEALDFAPDTDWVAHAGPEYWRLHRHNCMAHLEGLESEPVVVEGAPPASD